MSTRQHPDRSIAAWLTAEVPERASERLLEASRDQIRITRQRRVPGPAWRSPVMNTYAKLVIAAAVVLVVAVVGINLLPGGIGTIGSSPSATPTASAAAPSPSAGASEPALVPGAFTACVPTNDELRRGTDEQVVVPHPDGDMTVARRRGFTWAGAITATDERFSGTHYYSFDADEYTLPSGQPGPEAFAEGHRIENDQGAWQGWAVGAGMTRDDGTSSPAYLTGEGAYQGLTAILFLDDKAGCFFSFRGLFMDFPEPPVPATSQ